MDEQAYQILAKVHKIISGADAITPERRAYVSGLLETLLTMYQTQTTEVPPHKRNFIQDTLDKLNV